MFDWVFSKPSLPPELDNGSYRVRISDISECYSKSRNIPMLRIKFDVAGSDIKLSHFLVFDASSQKAKDISNYYFYRFCAAFGVMPVVKNYHEWIGKIALADVELIERDGYKQNRIKKFSPVDQKQKTSQPPVQLSNLKIKPAPFVPDDPDSFFD